MGRIVVIHPDLGVGGAERLIIDASKALQDCGHHVRIYTGYHNKGRCFEETKDGTLKTYTLGGWIPRTIFGRFHALMAYLKMMYIAFYVVLFSKHDVILCDQVSACIPILKLDFKNKSKIVFYCHFPDQLLTHRDSLAKCLYRKPIDIFEEYSTGIADIILVNSKFTSSVVKRTFTSLRNTDLTVLYPCVDVNSFVNFKSSTREHVYCNQVRECSSLSKENFTLLSLNRFERKKNLALAIEALNECILGYQELNKQAPSIKIHLIIAGGYDERLQDCVKYYEELKKLVEKLKLNSYVTFLKSPSDVEKLLLLESCHVVVYTPENEHFGIVPLEAMAMSKPVIATASGGPLETIESDVNGILCEPDRYSFADAMLRLYNERECCTEMGLAGLTRVKKQFSYETFRTKLNQICYPS